jgi:hypothetical protein
MDKIHEMLKINTENYLSAVKNKTLFIPEQLKKATLDE